MHPDYGEISDDDDCYEDNKRRSKRVSAIHVNERGNRVHVLSSYLGYH